MEILTDIPVELTVAEALKHMRMRKKSASFEQTVNEVLEMVRPVAQPKAMYMPVYVEHKGENTVSLDGVTFTSRVLRRNLDSVERVFPYVTTCGKEVDEIAAPQGDLLKTYCLDAVKELLMRSTRRYLKDYISRKYAVPQMSAMAPGSLQDWPITEQRGLFSLFGDVQKLIGVQLTDSCLMIPVKSTSGIYFPTEVRFESCQLCPRAVCSGRRAPYDPELARSYGLNHEESAASVGEAS
ncbi:MAG: vitamin B12 dependent-methionine synthase activation domain-containing protein [Chloroflexota bacterium]